MTGERGATADHAREETADSAASSEQAGPHAPLPATFIGGGNMATALIGGLVEAGVAPRDLQVVEPVDAQRERLAARFGGIRTHAAVSADALAGSAIAILAVKPQQMRDVARSLAPHVAGVAVVLTIAAGIRIDDLARWLGGYRSIVRAMPNTPALVARGISGVYAEPSVGSVGRGHAARVLDAAGDVVWCADERALDAVTGLSGSGPAYVFYLLEALEQAGVEQGLDAATARRLAYATFDGAVALARASGDEPSTLRANVTSKGGTTERGLAALAARDVAAAVREAVAAATARARELGDGYGAG